MLTEVNKSRLTLDRVVELCCYNPAKLTGYLGIKGVIQVGADADLVVLDMDDEDVLHADQSHYRCGWMPSEDFPVKGKPTLTVLRGNVIMENGEVTAEAGSGRLLRGRPDGNGAR
jgi:dihydroorotase